MGASLLSLVSPSASLFSVTERRGQRERERQRETERERERENSDVVKLSET